MTKQNTHALRTHEIRFTQVFFSLKFAVVNLKLKTCSRLFARLGLWWNSDEMNYLHWLGTFKSTSVTLSYVFKLHNRFFQALESFL